MIANLRAEFEVLVWVRDFGAAHARLFPPGSEGARLLAEIVTAVDVLTRYAAFTELNALIEKLAANIKVREDGTVKVLDFGLAKVAEPAVASSSTLSLSHNR